jgi:hypothetical protein
VLGLVGRQSTYRDVEVKDALVRSHSAIVAMQREDGSFPDVSSAVLESHLLDQPRSVENDSVPALMSLWLRILALTIIEHRYHDTFPAAVRWQFHPWPGLGYHSSATTLTDHERDVLPLWIRPTVHGGGSRGDVASAPAVSVVVPCYNLGRYLHEAVESVLAQDLPDLEIVVVDDGSTDEYTQLLLEHFARPKTRIIRQSNQGVASARNNGIRAGAGRYICCLDPDDRLRPIFLAKAVEILDRHPDVGLVSGYLAEFDEREQVVRHDACVLPDLLTYNPVIEPAVFRRQAWEESGGYYSGFSSSGIEDWDLSLSVLERGYRAAVIPEIVWDYRIRSDQMSTKMNEPETWGQLIRELVARHPDTYRKHMTDVIVMLATRFADVRGWAVECRTAAAWWERQSGNQERAADMWRRQAEDWEGRAARSDQAAASLTARIAELERELTARDQSAVLRQARVVELERELTMRDQAALSQQSRTAELERDLRIRDETLRHQQTRTAELDRELATRDETALSQQARIANLERHLAAVDARRLTRRLSRWWSKLSRSSHDRSE